jgi:phosphate/sulfate permease
MCHVIDARIARTAIATATLLTALLMYPADVRACSCADIGTSPEGILGRDAVFRGTIVAFDVPWTLQPGADGTLGKLRYGLAAWTDATVTVRMQVHEAWKGVDAREVVIDVGDGFCCNCSLGTDFGRPGEELLVYANEHEGALHVGFCNQPIPIAHADPYLEVLGSGQRSFEPGRAGALDVPMWVQIAGAIAFAVGCALIWWPRSPAKPSREPSE